MSCKKGNANHKKRCERYKAEGRREKNKVKKQLRHQKRLDRFAKRREDGKAYVYDKTKSNPENGTNVGSKTATVIAKRESLYRQLDNELRKIAEEKKLVEQKQKNRRQVHRKSDGQRDEEEKV